MKGIVDTDKYIDRGFGLRDVVVYLVIVVILLGAAKLVFGQDLKVRPKRSTFVTNPNSLVFALKLIKEITKLDSVEIDGVNYTTIFIPTGWYIIGGRNIYLSGYNITDYSYSSLTDNVSFNKIRCNGFAIDFRRKSWQFVKDRPDCDDDFFKPKDLEERIKLIESTRPQLINDSR